MERVCLRPWIWKLELVVQVLATELLWKEIYSLHLHLYSSFSQTNKKNLSFFLQILMKNNFENFERQKGRGFAVLVGLIVIEGYVLGVISRRIFFCAWIILMASDDASGFLPPPLYFSMCWMAEWVSICPYYICTSVASVFSLQLPLLMLLRLTSLQKSINKCTKERRKIKFDMQVSPCTSDFAVSTSRS